MTVQRKKGRKSQIIVPQISRMELTKKINEYYARGGKITTLDANGNNYYQSKNSVEDYLVKSFYSKKG